MVFDALLLGFLEDFGLRIQLGAWAAMLLAAFYIWKMLSAGERAHVWFVRVAISLVVIAILLAVGVLTGVNTERIGAIVATIGRFVFDAATQVIGFFT